MSQPLWLAVAIIFCTIQSATCQGKSIKCSSGTFTKCQSAKVSCTFTEDIRKTRKNFNIVHYPFNRVVSHSDAGTYVLVCNWGQGADGLECKTEEGYVFNKNVNDTLSLEIPDVSYRLAGVYVCQMVPDENIPLETCTLTVEAADVSQAAKDTGLSTCPAVDCGKDVAGLIIAVLILVIIILFVIIVFVVSKRLPILQKCGRTNEENCLCFGKSGTTEATQLVRKSETQTSSGGDQNENKQYDEPTEPLLKGTGQASAAQQSGNTVNAGSAGSKPPAMTTTPTQGTSVDRPLPLPPKEADTKLGATPPLMATQPGQNTKDFMKWDNKEVCLWLERVGMKRFVNNFKEKNMTGQDLVFQAGKKTQTMTLSTLKTMGITKKKDRDAVKNAIEALIKADQ